MEYLPLFVYGTLRNGLGNYNHYLRDRTADEIPGIIKATMFDIGAFPAVVCGEGTVQGELMYIKLTDYVDTMRNCDRLEGYHPDADSNMYVRQNIEVQTSEGTERAWVYVWNLPTNRYPVVRCGDWAEHRYKKCEVMEG